MNKNNKIKCVVLVAREHGLSTLRELQSTNNYQITAIFTHKFNPKSYDAERKIRDDFEDFQLFASQNKISLYTIDSTDQKKLLEDFASKNEFEFLLSISWRYLIPPQVFEKAEFGAINLHRGDLPKYAGVEPIRKALENNEERIVICCHHITKNYDEGEVIFKSYHDSNYDKGKSLELNIERLKKEITKYFPELTIKTLKHLTKEDTNEK